MGGQEPPPNPHDTRQHAIYVNVVISLVVVILVIVLRLITRIWIVRKFGWDDFTVLLATLGHIIGLSLVMSELHYGFGLHREVISESSYVKFQKLSYGEWTQTFQTLMFHKLSICFFLLRLPVKIWMIRLIQGAVAFLIITNAILTFVWIFQCWPVSAIWNTNELNTCMTSAQLQRIIISQAIVSMISDLFLAFFPVLLLWNIQMPRRSKVGLCSLMGLGLVTAGLCLTRTILNWENINHDPTWESIPNWGFRNWEITVGIILASIPALRPGYRVCATALARYNSAHTGSTRPSNPSHDRHSHHRTMFPTDPPRRLSNKTYGFSDDILLQSTAVDNDSRHSVAADEADEKARFARELARPSQLPSWETTSRAAGHTARVEVDRPAAAGEGDEAVAMKRLSGGVEVGERGITKTVWFGTETEPEENQRRSSGGGGDLERGESGRAFV